MQFTPKTKRTLTGVRYNPYASAGKSYLGKYKHNIRVCNSTPKKRILKPLLSLPLSQSCRRSLNPHMKTSLTDENITSELHNDVRNETDGEEEVFTPTDPLQLVSTTETHSPIKKKSSISDILNLTDDEFDKENNNLTQNSFYKKDTPKRSHSVLLEIPPVENGHSNEEPYSANTVQILKQFKFKRIETVTEEPEPEYPHLIGFPNYGNTCYLNSVLQALVGLPPFIHDIVFAQNFINLSSKSITSSLSDLIYGREKCKGNHVGRALRYMKENIERVDEAFAGFKMQDANEFLTQILDNVKDEISDGLCPIEPSRAANVTSWRNPSDTSEEQVDNFEDSSPEELLQHSIFSQDCIKEDDIRVSFLPMPEATNCQPSIINPVKQNFGFELMETYQCLRCQEIVVHTQEHFALYVNLPKEEEVLNIQKSVEAYLSEDQREVTCEKCGHDTAKVTTSFIKLPRILIVQLKRYEYDQEHYECYKVSAKVDLNMWLYLGGLTSNGVDTAPPWTPRPIAISNSALNNVEQEVTIDVSVSTSLHVDKLSVGTPPHDGPRPQDESLPSLSLDDLQVVPLDESLDKEEEDLQMAIKLSLQATRICYSTDDTSDETSEEEAFSEDDNHAYRLLSVISHFGQTTTTGHYVADVLNCTENQWYHYDDDTVVKLQEAVLMAEQRQKNAYIYFYAEKNLYENLCKAADS